MIISSMTESVLSIDSVDFSWGKSPCLSQISFTAQANSLTAVTGPAGCGKSTLLRILATLEGAYRGKMLLGGVDRRGFSSGDLKAWRQKLGVVLNPLGNFDWLTAKESLQFVLTENGQATINSASDSAGDSEVTDSRIERTLASVGLNGSAHLYPHEMSGGMQKRLALARALILGPQLLILDDPTAGLDPVTGREILELIESLKGSATVILATSDSANVLRLADHVVFIVGGQIQFSGSVEAFRSSRHPGVRQFLEARTDGPIS